MIEDRMWSKDVRCVVLTADGEPVTVNPRRWRS